MKGKFKFGNPVIEFEINGTKLEFLLDTGFNGQLMLSKRVIENLDLKQIGHSDYTNASGDKKSTVLYLAKINFFGEERECVVLSTEGNFSLIGMELLHECRVIVERHRDIIEIAKTI